MFLNSFLRILKGYLQILINTGYPEGIINSINKNGIGVWALKKEENGISLCVGAREYKKLIPLLKNAEVKVINEYGMPLLLKRYKNRWGLFLGGILFFVLVFFMGAFIWSVDISGNINIPTSQIEAALNECGFGEGSLKAGMSLRKIRQKMRVKIPEIAYMELNIKGSRGYVKIVEREPAAEPLGKTPCNLIAGKAGVIERTEVTGGQPMVKVGDTVDKGTLLVSGIIDSGEIGYFLVPSRANIYALCDYNLSTFCPYNAEVEVKSGEFIQKNRLRIFNFYINLYFGGGIDYPLYDKIIKIRDAKIGEYVLPVAIESTIYYEKEVLKKTFTKKECEMRALLALEEKAMYEFSGKEVKGSQITVEYNENGCIARGSYNVIENIAVPSPIYN